MYFAVIDCGTTNSRIYLINDSFELVYKLRSNIGVRDTVIKGSKEYLKKGLARLFSEIVKASNIKAGDISFIIIFGMITSEIGLKEIPHLAAPVGLKDLASNLVIDINSKVFPNNCPIIYIRGIKNNFNKENGFNEMEKLDFMRGEETQVFGLLSTYSKITLPVVAVILSSHTKYIYIDKLGRICSSITTLSGQLYEALKNNSSISKSFVIKNENDIKKELKDLDKKIIQFAYNSLNESGFLRSLLMPRFLELLIDTKLSERALFINSVISADDLKALNDFKHFNYNLHECNFVLIVNEIRCKILKYLLENYFQTKNKPLCIYDENLIDNLGYQGAISLLNVSGYLSTIN